MKTFKKHAWDGEWFMRGYRVDGEKFGSKENREGRIYLNPQTWAVMSGTASKDQAELVMKKVKEHLATEYGVALCNPPYTYEVDNNIVRSALFNPSMKENGAIFTHTQGWAVMAENHAGSW